MKKYLTLLIFIIFSNCAQVYTVNDYLNNWKLNLNEEYLKNNSNDNIKTDSISECVEKIMCSIYPPVRQHTFEKVYVCSNRKLQGIEYYNHEIDIIENEINDNSGRPCLMFSIIFEDNKINFEGKNYEIVIAKLMYLSSGYWFRFTYRFYLNENLNPVFIRKIKEENHAYAK